MNRGVVKFFHEGRGFGFIINEQNQDVFVHYTDIVCEGWKNLDAGCLVEFEIQNGPKGLHAKNVVCIKR